MFYITSDAEGEVGAVKLFKTPSNLLLTVPMQYFCCASYLLDLYLSKLHVARLCNNLMTYQLFALPSAFCYVQASTVTT